MTGDEAIRALPPFEPSATCPKCGYTGITTRYHDRVKAWCDEVGLPPEYTRARDEFGEHLMRLCDRCKYEWAEACIGDTVAEGVAP